MTSAVMQTIQTAYKVNFNGFRAKTNTPDPDQACFKACGGDGTLDQSICPSQAVKNTIALGLLKVYVDLAADAANNTTYIPIADVYSKYGVDPTSAQCRRSDVFLEDRVVSNVGQKCPTDITRSLTTDFETGAELVVPKVLVGEFAKDNHGIVFAEPANRFELKFKNSENEQLLGGQILHAAKVPAQSTAATVQSQGGPYCARITGISSEDHHFTETIIPLMRDASARAAIRSFTMEAITLETKPKSGRVPNNEASSDLESSYATYFPVTSHPVNPNSDGYQKQLAAFGKQKKHFSAYTDVQADDLLEISDLAFCALSFNLSSAPSPIATQSDYAVDAPQRVRREEVAGHFLQCMRVAELFDHKTLVELTRIPPPQP